ncbi:aldo/keto reductase [Nocardia terpenica]|uniref:Aldo/keto reductase n=1 Tax=Nocardia terpenica TaxID=455432 RepID=A0A164LBM2_9NOCA|nr:aldo/keto reductase [Nocardia terpenica]KZM72227.1 aldo/keto reductase [Nocardia terpenica]NQE86629.1 aldo/keto reductase [Nocardia terpenica]
MITRTLGSSGIEVSGLGIGCWAIGGPDTNLGLPMGWGPVDESAAIAGLERAWESGVTLFDTADVYGHGRSERLLGQLVPLVQRERIQLVSKVGYFAGTAAHGYDPGHMRRQLEQTLDNLNTDWLDVYFFHHSEFGPDDERLELAIEMMNNFRTEGLIRAIGMRGPHRYAPDRLSTGPKANKEARFRELFDRIRPQVLAVRDNLLTPQTRSNSIFTFAEDHGCGVLINKPLSQGLLTGAYTTAEPRTFGPQDHRARKRWFTGDAVRVIEAGLDQVRALVGPESNDLVRIALWSCLMRSDNAAVLVGFSDPQQVQANIDCLGERPGDEILEQVRAIMADVQKQLDADGEVFVDEVSTGEQQ